ncbi:MAG: ankyrin repeat domain-containing protein [Spirochaetes bacterium]|nr:ankyrin repeat domain-containing protein [Spirochaetota bacterium]
MNAFTITSDTSDTSDRGDGSDAVRGERRCRWHHVILRGRGIPQLLGRIAAAGTAGRLALALLLILGLGGCAGPSISTHGGVISRSYADPESLLHRSAAEGDIITLMGLVEEKLADIDSADSYGWTACMYAVRYRHEGLLEYLIGKKADIDRRDNSGQTALMVAGDSDYPEMAVLLLRGGADRNLKDVNGYTALMRAVYYRSIQAIPILADRSTVQDSNAEGQTALHIAALYDCGEAIPVLLRHGAPVNRIDIHGATPLMYAVTSGNMAIASAILKTGTNTNIRSGDGATALLLAVRGNFAEMVTALLEKRADPDIADNRGMTPLMEACYCGYYDPAVALLRHGADVTRKNIDGKTAIDIAVENRYGYMAALVRRFSR